MEDGMAQPISYKRTKNFQENAGDATDHGALNSEFDAIATTTSGILENLALIQNDDGTLAAGAVTENALSEELQQALKGETGATGPQGPQGEQGPKGDTGPQGEKGDTGASFDADARGKTEDKALYDTRVKGFSFLDIETGTMYFKLSNASGDWSTGVQFGKGETGATGATGPQGPQGEQGERGPKGDPGDTGATGPAGKDGAVTSIDSTQKSVNIVGRRRVLAKLVLSNGVLSIELSAE